MNQNICSLQVHAALAHGMKEQHAVSAQPPNRWCKTRPSNTAMMPHECASSPHHPAVLPILHRTYARLLSASCTAGGRHTCCGMLFASQMRTRRGLSAKMRTRSMIGNGFVSERSAGGACCNISPMTVEKSTTTITCTRRLAFETNQSRLLSLKRPQVQAVLCSTLVSCHARMLFSTLAACKVCTGTHLKDKVLAPHFKINCTLGRQR